MGVINEYINGKFKDVASKLPTLVHTEPASFSCGFNTGYKQAMIDLEHFLEDIPMPEHLFKCEWEEL